MKEVPFHNNAPHAKHFGSMTIPAGETRMVPAHLIPDIAHQAEPEQAPEEVTTLDILDGTIDEVIAALKARNDNGTPVVSDSDIEELQVAEENGKNRKGVISAIAEEMLERATDPGDSGDDVETEGSDDDTGPDAANTGDA